MAGGEPPRKLAFHEPRPCPICRRMYRDAATLRTHTAIMHAEGRDKFACLCGELFRTKYEMYNHKKNGHMWAKNNNKSLYILGPWRIRRHWRIYPTRIEFEFCTSDNWFFFQCLVISGVQ